VRLKSTKQFFTKASKFFPGNYQTVSYAKRETCGTGEKYHQANQPYIFKSLNTYRFDVDKLHGGRLASPRGSKKNKLSNEKIWTDAHTLPEPMAPKINIQSDELLNCVP